MFGLAKFDIESNSNTYPPMQRRMVRAHRQDCLGHCVFAFAGGHKVASVGRGIPAGVQGLGQVCPSSSWRGKRLPAVNELRIDHVSWQLKPQKLQNEAIILLKAKGGFSTGRGIEPDGAFRFHTGSPVPVAARLGRGQATQSVSQRISLSSGASADGSIKGCAGAVVRPKGSLSGMA